MNDIYRDNGPGVLERIGARAHIMDVNFGSDADGHLLAWVHIAGGGGSGTDRDVYLSDRDMMVMELAQALGAATACGYFEQLLAGVTARGESTEVIDRVKRQVEAAHVLLPKELAHFHDGEEGV